MPRNGSQEGGILLVELLLLLDWFTAVVPRLPISVSARDKARAKFFHNWLF